MEKTRKCAQGTKSKSSESLVKCTTVTAEMKIKECAFAKQDHTLLGKIDGVDLRAKEARYHESCRCDYIRQSECQHRACGGEEESSSWNETRSAYGAAFEFVYDYVSKKVMQGGKVVRMSMLHNILQDYMQNHHPEL